MPYDNTNRRSRAEETASRVLAAGRRSFVDVGYGRTTIRVVADLAHVSQETVYKRFGGKAGLLKAVYDVTLAGDERPVPMAERPEYAAVWEARTAAEVAVAYGRLAGFLSERVGPLLSVVLANRGGDPELEAFAATIDGERLIGATMGTRAWADRGWLAPGLSPEKARDTLWTVNSPAVYLLLTERGWTLEEYQGWITGSLRTMIFGLAPAE